VNEVNQASLNPLFSACTHKGRDKPCPASPVLRARGRLARKFV